MSQKSILSGNNSNNSQLNNKIISNNTLAQQTNNNNFINNINNPNLTTTNSHTLTHNSLLNLQQQTTKYLSQNQRKQHNLNLNINNKQALQKHITANQNHDNDLFVLQLQSIIFTQIKKMQFKQVKGNYIMASITDDLEEQILEFQEKLKNSNEEEILNIRMHVQAINKILVFIHGKSQFRLVMSHFHIAQAYLKNKCYEQAIDHFTIALKKNTKITQVKQTKIYHSYILTSLAQCYFQLQLFEDSIQILNRAYQIQQCFVNSQLKINNIKTIKLISCCFLKLKNFKAAIQYIEKILPLVQRLKGINSQEYVQTKYQKSIINAQEGNLQSAREEVKNAIQLLESNTFIDQYAKIQLMIKYYKQLAQFQQKFCDFSAQIQCYRVIQQLLSKVMEINIKKINNINYINQYSLNQKKNQNEINLKNILLTKKKIAIVSVNQGIYNSAIKQLQQILQIQINKYGQKSQFACKTLKMLGLVHLNQGNQKHAQQYLKKSYKMSKQFKMSQQNNKLNMSLLNKKQRQSQKKQNKQMEKLLTTLKINEKKRSVSQIRRTSHLMNININNLNNNLNVNNDQ